MSSSPTVTSYQQGKWLETITLYYCTATGRLMDANVIPKPTSCDDGGDERHDAPLAATNTTTSLESRVDPAGDDDDDDDDEVVFVPRSDILAEIKARAMDLT